MQLFRRERHGRDWASCPTDEEVELARGAATLIRRSGDAVLVSAPHARVLVGARAAAPVEILGAGVFSVAGDEFRLRHEPLAPPEAFRVGSEARACARCKLELCDGDVAIRCRCGAFLHEGERANGGMAVRCLSYLPHCPCGVERGALERGEAEDGDA